MGHSVVIVESPAKARTLGRYLGSGYTVKASMGHVVDLPAKSMGIDIEADFKPEYVVIPNREATLRELKKAIKGAEKVFLAPDPDREGEAIAYHLKEHLGIAKKKLFRVTFNEITKRAVEEAFKTPGQIDMDLVNAQQARRIMDRLVGYKLSPLLWEKITQGLSAGRVQSVAVRLIAEREKEIEAFRSDEYWKVAAVLGAEGAEEEARFLTELKKIDGKAAKIADGDEAEAVRLGMMAQHFAVVSVTEKERKDSAKAPLNTSLLQQQGSIRLRFSAKKTMMVAQQLYEGIELGDQGPVGLITYMRTDSYHIAKEALQGVRDFIASTMGKDWLSEKPNVFKARKGAQAAHEAIRPTDVTRTPDSLKSFLKRDQLRLYSLIWERFVACQMAPARWAVSEIILKGGPYDLQIRGRRLLFPGHLRVWGDENGGARDGGKSKPGDPELPKLAEGEPVDLHEIHLNQHFTQPPPRFTEATLVKILEKEGIGRPSTYAPIISTIQGRGYVKLRERRFFATEIGMIVTELLVSHFPHILEVDFTSRMEEELDRIEEAEADWVKTLKDFYGLFQKDLDRARREMPDLKKNPEPSGELCDACSGRLMIRVNRHGRFLGCENYPKCRTTVSLDEEGNMVKPEETDFQCNLCGKTMLLRTGRRGRFLGCSGYPECRNTLSIDDEGRPVVPKPTGETCEKCGASMVEKRGRRGPFFACSAYPDCKNTRPLPGSKEDQPRETGEPCDQCGKPMVVRYGKRGPFIACSGYPDCKNTRSLPKKKKDPGEETA